MGYDQVTKVVKGVEVEVDEIKMLSTLENFSKEIIKMAHFSTRETEMCRTLCSLFKEGEEDFKTMGFRQIVPLPF